MSKRRVVVTGLGIVSPVGIGIAAAWENLTRGVSGVAPITRFDASALPTRFAAEVKGFTSADWMPPKETRRSDLFVHFGLAATRLALEDAGLVIDDSNAERVGEAGRMIEYGDAEVMIAGGAEACINMSGVGGFCACKALSERNDDPATASRPFDKDRDGFVLGEGAGILILEEYEHAKKRGARIYAEL